MTNSTKMTANGMNYTPLGRASLYNERFPDRPGLSEAKGMVGGTWCIGACYKNPNRLYGAYPYGYLDRVHAMFPEVRSILHVFSGGLKFEDAVAFAGFPMMHQNNMDFVLMENRSMELVDSQGPDQGRYPTWQGPVEEMPEDWAGRFDLVLADPPYSKDDAKVYGVPMYGRKATMEELYRVTKVGGNLVWLSTCWPQHRRTMWKTWAQIGLVRSTLHRMRLVTMFERGQD